VSDNPKEARGGRITEHGWVPDSAVTHRYRKGKMRPLSVSLAKVNRLAFGKRSPIESELSANWQAVVGQDVSQITLPLEMKFPNPRERLNGTLLLAVKSVRALEIQHREPQLIERINRFLGYSAVARVQLRQGSVSSPIIDRVEQVKELESVPESELEESGIDFNQVKDPELRQALVGWIGVLAARNRKKPESQ
jgi:hypothetical protein